MKMRISILLLVIICVLALIPKNGSQPVFSETDSERILVLMYHSVLPEGSKKYVISPEKLEEDILYLKENGYNSVSCRDLIKYVYQGGTLPEKPVLLTFDDGMYNNMTEALPLLEKHNFYAVFSIVGSYADEYTESGVENPRYSCLNWQHINNLSQNPLIEFANHSYSFHTVSKARNGTRKNKGESSLDYIRVFYEDTQKMQSAFFTGCKFSPFIYTYPFGTYSRESSRVLHKMNFLITFSCNEGISKISPNVPDCLYLLKRYNRDGRKSTKEFFASLKL